MVNFVLNSGANVSMLLEPNLRTAVAAFGLNLASQVSWFKWQKETCRMRDVSSPGLKHRRSLVERTGDLGDFHCES